MLRFQTEHFKHHAIKKKSCYLLSILVDFLFPPVFYFFSGQAYIKHPPEVARLAWFSWKSIS